MVYVATSPACATAIRRGPISFTSTQPFGADDGAEGRLDLDLGYHRRDQAEGHRLKDSLPDALKIGFIGDQSLSSAGRITGVAVEGVIRALMTSVMILLFLGSWRSTIIHRGFDSALGVAPS